MSKRYRAPTAPSSLTGVAVSGSEIDLSWHDNSSNETGFAIERAPDGLAYLQIGVVAPGVTSFKNTGLAAATLYYYRVRAMGQGGNSAPSNVVSLSTVGAFVAPPNPPSALVATAFSDTRIDLAWTDNSTDEDGFSVERSADNITFTQIATVGASVTGYSDTGRTASTLYYYRVRAFSTAGNSGYCAVASATTLATVIVTPTAPSALTATAASPSRIDLAWTDNSSDETGFRISRSTDNVTYAEIAVVGADVTVFSDTGRAASTLYYYKVRAYNAGGNSAFTTAASDTTDAIAAPTAPSALTAAAVSSTQIDLAWTDNSSDEDGFKIERAPDSSGSPGTFAQIAVVGPDTVAYSDTGRAASTKYWYKVRAYNAGGNSAYTSNATDTTAAPPLPTAPSALTATAVSSSQINLAWTDNASNETGFAIERSADGVTFAQVATVGVNVAIYSDTGLSAATLYYYRVKAFNASGSSAVTASASALTLAVAPPAGHYVATNGNDSTGDGSYANPWRTIVHGLATMAGATTLWIRGGTYNESGADGQNGLKPKSGTSWNAPTLVAAYPGETVIVQRASGDYVFYFYGNKQYIELRDLIIDGGGGNISNTVTLTDDSSTSLAPAHIRLRNCEVRNSKNQGISNFQNVSGATPTTKIIQDLQILGGSVHDNGDGIRDGVAQEGFEHGMYLQCANSLIDGVTIYNNRHGLGAKIYNEGIQLALLGPSTTWCSNNIIRNCVAYGNLRYGIQITTGTGNVAYNNVCYNNERGLVVDGYADQTELYNNTCYNNTNNFLLGPSQPVTNVLLENNIAWHPASGSRTTNNFNSANGSTYTLVTNQNLTTGTSGTDPLFVNPAVGDFHLQAGSPCIDTGTDASGAGVTTDKDGVARPQRTAFDKGAYEKV